MTCAKPCKNRYKINVRGLKLDSAAEGRPLVIFGGLRSSLFASRIRFRYSSCTFFAYVGRPILCAGASPRCFFLCLGSTRVSGFYAQVRVPGALLSNLDFCPKCYGRGKYYRASIFSIFLEAPYFNSLSLFACPRLVFLWRFSDGFCWLTGWLPGSADRPASLACWWTFSVIVLVAAKMAGDALFW